MTRFFIVVFLLYPILFIIIIFTICYYIKNYYYRIKKQNNLDTTLAYITDLDFVKYQKNNSEIITYIYKKVNDFYRHSYTVGNYSIPTSIEFLTELTHDYFFSRGFQVDYSMCKKLIIEAIINQGISSKEEIISALNSVQKLLSIRPVKE